MDERSSQSSILHLWPAGCRHSCVSWQQRRRQVSCRLCKGAVLRPRNLGGNGGSVVLVVGGGVGESVAQGWRTGGAANWGVNHQASGAVRFVSGPLRNYTKALFRGIDHAPLRQRAKRAKSFLAWAARAAVGSLRGDRAGKLVARVQQGKRVSGARSASLIKPHGRCRCVQGLGFAIPHTHTPVRP